MLLPLMADSRATLMPPVEDMSASIVTQLGWWCEGGALDDPRVAAGESGHSCATWPGGCGLSAGSRPGRGR